MECCKEGRPASAGNWFKRLLRTGGAVQGRFYKVCAINILMMIKTSIHESVSIGKISVHSSKRVRDT